MAPPSGNGSSGSGSSNAVPHIDAFVLFNQRLSDFVEDLNGVLGHLPQYKVMVASVTFMSKYKEKQNQQLFDRYVALPYGASIEKEDEAFLLSEEYVPGSGQDPGGIVPLIKSVWRSLSDMDKASVWAHMHVLLALNRRCLDQESPPV